MIGTIVKTAWLTWCSFWRHYLPLRVSDWCSVGAVSGIVLTCYVYVMAWYYAPRETFQIYWRLRWYNLWGDLAPKFVLPSGKTFESWGPYCTTLYEGMITPYLHRAEWNAALFFPILSLFLAWNLTRGKEPTADKYTRGSRILDEKDLAALTEQESCLLPLGAVRLPRQYEEKHVVVTGDRAGRKIVFTQQLQAIRGSSLPAVVFDPGGEYLERFYLSGVDQIANPYDHRGFVWNLLEDLEDGTDLTALTYCAVPGNSAAQNLLRGLVVALCAKGKKDNTDLWAALNASPGVQLRLCASVEGGEAACRLLESPYSCETVTALTLLRSRLSWLEASQGKGSFSLKSWLSDPQGSAIFLPSLPNLEDPLRTYTTMLVSALMVRMLNRKKPGERVFFLLDELAGLDMIPCLKWLVANGHGSGVALLLGVRDLAGLEELYGNTGTQTILNGCETLLALKIADGRTANFFAWRFGEREYWDAPIVDAVHDGKSSSWRFTPRTNWLILGSQLQEIPEGFGCLRLPMPRAAQVRVVPTEANRLPPRAPRFVTGRSMALDGVVVKKVRRSEREVQLGLPMVPGGLPSGGPGAVAERRMNRKLEF